jgi:hypothetical protein
MRIHHRTCAVPFHLANPDVLRRVSRSLHKCSLGAVKLEKVQSAAAENLTCFSVQSTPDHRSCVHIQSDTRTMTFPWGLLHLWLYRPGPDSCRQPTFTCSEARASSSREVPAPRAATGRGP